MTLHLRLAVVRPPSSSTVRDGTPPPGFDTADEGDVHSAISAFSVRAPAGTTWRALRLRLELDPCADGFECDGSPLSDGDLLGHPPLLDGALVEPARTTAPTREGSALRLTSVSGPAQARRMVLAPGVTALGRHHRLLGDDDLASRHHVDAHLARGAVTVEDVGSSNGVFLDGRRLERGRPEAWRVGEHLRVGASTLRLDLDEWDAAQGPDPSSCTDDGHLVPVNAPRLDPPEPRVIDWPSPADETRHTPLRWIAALAPVPVAILAAIFMHSMMMLCFMALGPVVMIATHLDDRRRGRTVGRAAARRREQDVRRAAQEAARGLTEERGYLRALAPDPATVLDIAAGRAPGVGSRTGAARTSLRLGHGDAPSVHATRRQGSDTTRLALDESPVCVHAGPGALLHLDTAEDDADTVLELLVAQLALLNEPGERPVVITPLARSARWALATCSSTVRVTTTLPEDVRAVLDDAAAFGRRNARPPLVIVDERAAVPRELTDQLIASDGSVVWVGHNAPVSDSRQQTPTRTTTQRVALRRGHRRSALASGHAFTLDSPEPSWFPTVMRRQLRWATARDGRTLGVPIDAPQSAVDLLPQHPADGWRHPTMAVPIGRGHDGVMTLDLSRTGPHALVAGTTGAGKSEFLLTYLRGLFALNAPSDVNALLIDYKGGATFGALAEAPHVVGMVTDLDDGLAARALTALRAEITRREHVLADAGSSSYVDYRRAHPEAVGMPRFFVIVDEFRVLAEELPDFVTGLVRLAAVGRSLGMHLVLATQRPGGAVTADMRANLDVRIALRVRERSDSIDVIDAPDAARIARTHPGRGFLAVAGEAPVEFQTAFSGGPRIESVDDPLHVHPLVPSPQGVIESEARCEGCRAPASSARTDRDLFTQEACLEARSLPPVHRPLLPPLPEDCSALMRDVSHVVHTCDLLATAPVTSPLYRLDSTGSAAGAFAVVDLPAQQAQPALVIDAGCHIGLSGAPRSGRTTAAHAIAAAILEGRSDTSDGLWWAAPGPLDANVVARASRVFDTSDPAAVVQLLTALQDDDPVHAGTRCVVIDGWDELHAGLLRINHGLAVDDMLRHVADGHRRRQTFVVTGSRTVLASKLSTLLELKLVLRQNDTSEYSLAGLRPAQIPSAMPPGRALSLPHGHVLQFARPRQRTV